MIRTRFALAAVLVASAAMVTPAAAQYDGNRVKAKAPFRADAWGPKQGRPGTRCWVNGAGFRKNMTVLIGGRPVRLVKFAPQRIEFDIPRANYGDGRIVLRRQGHSDVIVGNFDVLPDPTIARFGPRRGTPGTRVEIVGTGFGPGIRVLMNGRPVRADEINPSRIAFRVPGWAKSDYIELAGDGYKIRTRRPFEVVFPAPIIRSVSPGGGGYGTKVRISGEHFDGSEQVYYGRKEIRAVTRGNGWVEFALPNWVTRPERLQVRNRYGESTWGQPFGLMLPPTVARFAPEYGGPGTEVTIFGRDFDRADWVSIGGVKLPIVDARPDQIRVKITRRARSGPLEVHRGSLVVATRRPFDVVWSPIIQSWGPQAGKEGTVVTLRGEHFGRRAEIYYGNRKLQPISARRGEIQVAVPGGMGPRRFRIVSRAGDVWTDRPFALHVYPVVSGINPRWGGPGDEIRISGRFLGQANGWFLGKAPLEVVRKSPREVVVRVPRGARSAKLWWNAHGARHGGSLDFDVRYGPTVTSFEPAFGPPGTLVTIRGEHLGGARAQVTWGPRDRLQVVKSGPGWITVEIPRRASGERYLFVDHYGQKVRSGAKFRVALPMAIDKVWPRQIGYGQTLNIGGGGYGRDPVVRIGKRNARIVSRGRGVLAVEVPGDVQPGLRWVWVTSGRETVKSPYQIEVRAPATITHFAPPRTWRGSTFIIHGDGFGPKVRVRVDGTWWSIKRIGKRGRRIWVEVPRDAPHRGQYWVEVVKAGGYVARSPQQLTLVAPPGSNVRDKRRKRRGRKY